MRRAITGLALAMVGAIAVPVALSGDGVEPGLPRVSGLAGTAAVVAGDPLLLARLQRIDRGSGLWREEADRALATGRRVVVLTAEQVVVVDRERHVSAEPFDPTLLAEVAPVPAPDGGIETVLVVVNLSLLNDIHTQLGSTWSERDADLDRILIHEVYGHALPYVVAGDVSGRCADPRADERPADACAIQRENAVRAELGLGRRTDAGVSGLALARYRSR